MKNNAVKIFAVLAIAVLLVIGAAVLGIGDGVAVLALPFTLLGKGLRLLSLSGTAGNVGAILLYILLCLSPLLLMIGKKRKKKDILLLICSGVLFHVLYYAVNPAYRPVILQNAAGDLAMAGAVYSVLLCWLILTLMGTFQKAGTDNIYDALRIFLLLCAAEFGVGIIVSIGGCVTRIQSIAAANTMPGLNLFPTYGFTALSYAVTVIEYAIDIWLLCLAGKLLTQLRQDAYSESTCNVAQKLSNCCRTVLITLTLSTTGLNLLQLFCASALYNVDIAFHLPTVSIGIAFVLLALTRLLYQGKELKEDNDLFI